MIIYVDENDENTRLDSFLATVTKDLSRAKLQSLIKSGVVKVNDSAKKPSYSIKENDKIDFEIPEQKSLEIKPQDITLDIVYEDENMLVVNKPSGMLIQIANIERLKSIIHNPTVFDYSGSTTIPISTCSTIIGIARWN